MTKSELIKAISNDTGVEHATVSAIVESAMSNIKDSLIKDEPVFLRGFGTFLNKVRKAKPARNIAAKTTIVIPEHKIPYFKPAKDFKNSVQ